MCAEEKALYGGYQPHENSVPGTTHFYARTYVRIKGEKGRCVGYAHFYGRRCNAVSLSRSGERRTAESKTPIVK